MERAGRGVERRRRGARGGHPAAGGGVGERGAAGERRLRRGHAPGEEDEDGGGHGEEEEKREAEAEAPHCARLRRRPRGGKGRRRPLPSHALAVNATECSSMIYSKKKEMPRILYFCSYGRILMRINAH